MNFNELRNLIEEYTDMEVLLFSNFNYADAFLGISYNHRAVYSYSKMVSSLIDQGMSEEDAIEWIDYNTLGSLTGSEKEPIIVIDNLM
jgi:hypothetical protein